jgi:RHS repeat-associated protein
VTLYSYSLTRDLAGRISSKSETIGGVTSTYDYTYDAVGRLSTVELNGSPYSSYTYDDNGNRVSGSIGGTSFSASYDDQDRIVAYNSKNYTYTTNGELSSIQSTPPLNDRLFAYDSMGNLGQYTSATGDVFDYIMDGQDRRVGEKKNGTIQWRALFSQNRQVAMISGGALKHEYVHATTDLAPDYMIDGANKLRLIKDHLGTVRLVVNVSTGVIVQRLDYDEWGKILSDTNPGYQPFAFAGGTNDPDTGFVKFGARDYDPETRRWTSKDPILFNGGDTNLYGYVMNDPINFVDPSGLFLSGSQLGGIIGGAIGGAASGAYYGTYVNPGLGTAGGALVGGLFGAMLGGLLGPHLANADAFGPPRSERPLLPPPFQSPPSGANRL